MRKVVCHDCRKRYDFDKDGFCPRCGAFTQPPIRPRVEENRTAPRPVRQKADVRSLKEKGKAAAALAETVLDGVLDAAGPAENALEGALKGISGLISNLLDE